MERKCFECNQPADHAHHVVPKVLGGTRTLPLCEVCHGKVHGCNWVNHGSLTRAGLQRAKAAGKVLGNPHKRLLGLAAQRGAATNRRKADAFAASTLPIIQAYQRQGMSLRAIAEELNKCGIPTARGGRWYLTQLVKILQRVR